MNAAPTGRPVAINVGPIKTGTFESVFNATGAPRLLLDTRTIAGGGPDAAKLLGPLLMRGVDEVYSRAVDEAEYYGTILPGDHDGLIWFAKSTPSALRP